MPHLELTLAAGETSLSVRRFSIREALSALFEIEITALSPNEDLDLEAIVGKAAAFRLHGHLADAHEGPRFAIAPDPRNRYLAAVFTLNDCYEAYAAEADPRLRKAALPSLDAPPKRVCTDTTGSSILGYSRTDRR